jgi:hypothetical protein
MAHLSSLQSSRFLSLPGRIGGAFLYLQSSRFLSPPGRIGGASLFSTIFEISLPFGEDRRGFSLHSNLRDFSSLRGG